MSKTSLMKEIESLCKEARKELWSNPQRIAKKEIDGWGILVEATQATGGRAWHRNWEYWYTLFDKGSSMVWKTDGQKAFAEFVVETMTGVPSNYLRPVKMSVGMTEWEQEQHGKYIDVGPQNWDNKGQQ